MKVTFVSDFLPCPPSSGVALPLFHLIKGLQKLHDVTYLYLDGGAHGFADDDSLAANARFVNLEVVRVRRKSRTRRAIDEIFQIAPYFHGFDLRNEQVPAKAQEADVYCFSPFTALAYSRSETLNKKAVKMAWINDSTTAMMRSRINYLHMKGISAKKKLHLLTQWLRSFYMGRLEAAALAEYDRIFVQTATEKRWIDRISNGRLSEQTRVVTNGVNDVLFKVPVGTAKPNFLFFGDMSGIYDSLAIWLLKNVWAILRDTVPNSNFYLIGKHASDAVLKIVQNDPRVHYQPYVENIEDVFLSKGVMLAPVFKDYGVINKVLESMASGVPVIGDRTAYNGIPGFEDGTHGIIANSAEEMAARAKQLLDDAVAYQLIASQARRLMQRSFSWESRIEVIDRIFREACADTSDRNNNAG